MMRRLSRRRVGIAVPGLIVAGALVAGFAILLHESFREHGAQAVGRESAYRTSDLGRALILPRNKFAAPRPQRPVYPYSVVGGGVYTPEELRQAAKTDPVVSSHYRDMDLGKLRPVKLRADKSAFVSYRLGSDVYWTKHRVKLSAGEVVLTDGEHLARARCGNRVSDVPQAGTSPKEPPPELFDTPIQNALAMLPEPDPSPLAAHGGPIILPPGTRTGGGGVPIIPPIIIPPGGGGTILPPHVPPGGGPTPPDGGPTPPDGGPTPPDGGPTPPPPPLGGGGDTPPPVPEPGTMLLVGSGIGSFLAWRRRARQ